MKEQNKNKIIFKTGNWPTVITTYFPTKSTI